MIRQLPGLQSPLVRSHSTSTKDRRTSHSCNRSNSRTKTTSITVKMSVKTLVARIISRNTDIAIKPMNLPQWSTSWASQITTIQRIKIRHQCTDPNPKPGKTGSQNIAHMMSKISINSNSNNILRLCRPQLTLIMSIQRWTTRRRTLHTLLASHSTRHNRLIMRCSQEPPLRAIIGAEGPRIIPLVHRFERIFMSSPPLSQPTQDS